MSQITRCPQCQTRFKVVDDQLRISDGWVRCGKCKSVFDALNHLVQRSELKAATAGVTADSSAHVGEPAQTAPGAAPLETSPQNVNTNVRSGTVAGGGEGAASDAEESGSASEHLPAVVVTGNSVPVDPHQQVPELSVLVFPRRGGFGDSGYVDSSWMSAYEDDAAVAKALAPPATPAVAQPTPYTEADENALESEWRSTVDQRPKSLRKSKVDFSAKDDLAELQAREGRLLEAIAEKKSKSTTTVVDPKASGTRSKSASAHAVLQPAPAPQVDVALAAPKDSEGALASEAAASEEVAAKLSEAAEQDAAPASVADNHQRYDDLEAPNRQEAPDKAIATQASSSFVAEKDEALAAERAAQADEPAFVREAKRKAFWSQPGVLVASLLVALVLVVGLVLQVLVTQRDQLAVSHPQWRPALEKVCRWAGCQIALPRHLHSVAIDSTSFNPIGPRQFKLTVVLRNTADYAVAMPALELSLNDAAEKMVLRRVLSPADMQAPVELAAHGEWTAVVAIQVADNGDGVVGYRVLAFYP